MTDADPFGRSPRRRFIDSGRAVAYPLVAVLALATGAARAGWLAGAGEARARAYVHLSGETDEQQPIRVELDSHDRIHALNVQLVGLCENGGRYTVGWAPDSPRIPFRSSPAGVLARESGKQRSSGGIVSGTVVWTTARVWGEREAAGDVRYETTFQYPSGRRLRCDSGYVHWSASQGGVKPRSSVAVLPPVSSLAVSPSPARVRFAANVDHTCARTFSEGQARQLRRRAAREGLIRALDASVSDHQHQYDAISRLGKPPEAATLYQSWRANMQQRIRLERLAVLQADRNVGRMRTLVSQVQFLGIEGDSLGQEFGLRICTSKGPLRARPQTSAVPDTRPTRS